jgi:hypothetical protein
MAIRYPLLLIISLATAATGFAAMPGSGRSPAPDMTVPAANPANVTVLYKTSALPVLGAVQPLDFPNARY